VAGAVSDPLLSLAVLFEVCNDSPPDLDNPEYMRAMQRGAEVLRTHAAQDKR
jgi:hypothetical protein